MRAFARPTGAAVLAVLCLAVPGTRDDGSTPVPRVAPVAAVTVSSSAATEVLGLVNAARRSAGCAPVRLDSRLTAAATTHSQDMARNDYFSHVSRDGDSFVGRVNSAGYATPRSENIAAGRTTAQATMQQWMDSPGHKRNILDCTAKDMGLGVGVDAGSTYRVYWTQEFGRG